MKAAFSDIFVVGSLCEETLKLLRKDLKPKISPKISKPTVHLFSTSNVVSCIYPFKLSLSHPTQLQNKANKKKIIIIKYPASNFNIKFIPCFKFIKKKNNFGVLCVFRSTLVVLIWCSFLSVVYYFDLMCKRLQILIIR